MLHVSQTISCTEYNNAQLLRYNGSKYLGIGIFIDNCFTYNLLCPVSISDEQAEIRQRLLVIKFY